ncbi:calcium/calmodulin-dependent protein kinase type II subunit beta-like isoform X1 [Amphibalanus amphitrite]|uniref:calcium/calmodulin-dependent protein kinase type II subunit beta-like isoform X1 n=2 Tax=Amphibalanus amphitrite TaxID=1232801 RepID=UPI001C903549|nr:calcium/calmodulin-dependent protein kinase type II subunit beta-like isoform X1 [Amphibalanus amphitrite]
MSSASESGTDDELMSIFVDESFPLEDLTLPFPPRDVTVRRNVEVREKFTMGEEVGRGKFGIVYRCTDKATGRQLAAKFVATPRKDDKRDVEREVEIMNYLQHPGIIQIFDAFDGGKEMTLVMELVEGGELFDRVIEDDYILTEKACAIFMRQVCAGVNFMHQKNVLHLDMKPENILCLSKTGNRIKIIDFGLARRYDPAKKLQVLFGTPEFVAPEVVNFDAIGYPTDMWSVGVIAYVLVSGLSPFMGDTDCETMANVTIAKYDFDDEAFDDVSDECKDFITKILIKDMSKRLTSAQALTHPWLTMRPPQQPMKARSRQASLACPEPHLETAQVNLTQFVERWLEHPTSPYAFSETSGDLALPRAGSAASVGLCSPSRCETLTTPELSSDEESSGDEEPLYRTETRPKPAEHTRVSNIRREESLKRARGRLVQQASKEERYISIDEVKTLKQQGSLDEMVAKVASLPTSRRGSVTQAPPPSRLRAPDSPRPQTPSPLASQPAGTPQRTQRQPSPAHASVCDRVMSEAAAALSDGTLDRQRLSPAPVTAVPAPSPSPGRSRSGAVSPLLAPTGKDSSPAKPTSRSPQPDSGPTLPVPTRSRSQTPSVTVTGAASPTADIERSAAKDTAAATSAEPDKLSVGDGKKPRKSKSKESVSSGESSPRRRRPVTTGESSETVPADPPASATTARSGKSTPEPKATQKQDSQNAKPTEDNKVSSQKTATEPKTAKAQEKQPTNPANDTKALSGKTSEPKTIKIQLEEDSPAKPTGDSKSSSDSRSSSGKTSPQPKTVKIQQEVQPEKINSLIFNLKPVKRPGPGPIATTLTTKAPSNLGMVQLKKVPSSKSDASLTSKAESEAAQVKLRRTRPSDSSISSQRDRPVLTRQKADTGGTAVKKKSSTKHRPKHELDASRSNSAETTPSQQPKNVRRPREHIVQIEVVGCAGPEQADRPSAPEPALRKLRQALRTLSSGSAQSAPSSPYPSREGSPGCELRPAGLLLRSWHRDRLRDGAGWSGRGPSLIDFVSARLEEAAGCQRREQERFERLLRQRRPLSPPPATRRPAKGPLDWRRLGWSITDW